MASTALGVFDGGRATAAVGASHPAGRIDVDNRALVKVSEAVTASAVGVSRKIVSVEVTESRAGLALRVRTPLPVPSLDDTAAIASGQPVLDRVAALQDQLRDRIGHLTGRDVARVTMTITGAVSAVKRRVI